jgi:hypothetical protein
MSKMLPSNPSTQQSECYQKLLDMMQDKRIADMSNAIDLPQPTGDEDFISSTNFLSIVFYLDVH